MAAISTVSSSSRRLSTVASTPYSASSPTRKARPISPCSSSVIPSAMSTVSFGSLPPWGALPDGSLVEPFRDPSRDPSPVAAAPPAVALLRLRRRRAERLVPVPVPADPSRRCVRTATRCRRRRCRRQRCWRPPRGGRGGGARSGPADPPLAARPPDLEPDEPLRCAWRPPCPERLPPRGGNARAWAVPRPDAPGPARGPRPGHGRRGPSWAR